MPTFGWVHEDAWEGFLAGTEPAFEPGPPGPPTFACPFCSLVLNRISDLQQHLASNHSIARPALLIDGKESEAVLTVRKRYSAANYLIVNATAVDLTVDSRHEPNIQPFELTHKLAGLSQATVHVILANSSEPLAPPVTSKYRIAFRIADPKVLGQVERAFYERLMDSSLTVSSISDFLADERCSGSGSDYAEGLAEYVLGVLVKEQPEGQDIGSSIARYRELFRASLQRLSPHRRPFAELLCAVMRFAINDFSKDHIDTGFWELNAATMMLKGPEQSSLVVQPITSPSRRRVCPVDHGTGRILALAVRLLGQDRWGAILGEECRQIADAGTLDIMDRQKALALWALTALRLGALQEASVPLAQLSATYPFSIWANPCLEAVTK
jgi:hypothetical protein